VCPTLWKEEEEEDEVEEREGNEGVRDCCETRSEATGQEMLLLLLLL
jgi:hypothetical protein